MVVTFTNCWWVLTNHEVLVLDANHASWLSGEASITLPILICALTEGVDPEKVFTLNERKEFTVLDIDKESRKISLSLLDKKTKK